MDERPQLEMLGVSSSHMNYNQQPNSTATLQLDMQRQVDGGIKVVLSNSRGAVVDSAQVWNERQLG